MNAVLYVERQIKANLSQPDSYLNRNECVVFFLACIFFLENICEEKKKKSQKIVGITVNHK